MPRKITSKKRKSGRIKIRPVPLNCSFCKRKTAPSYKDATILERFISDRAKILGKAKTGVCSKHQRKISQEIKRARHLGLLPFTPNI